MFGSIVGASIRRRVGFTLVELLAVVLILGVLAAVAVPLYINSRKAAAARTCLSNLAIIAAAQSAWAVRNGSYCYDTAGAKATETAYVSGTPPTGGLVGAPEGLATPLFCPLDGTTSYTCTQTGNTGNLVIACGNFAAHQAAVASYPVNKTLIPVVTEVTP